MSRWVVIGECDPELIAYVLLFRTNCCVRDADMSIGDVKAVLFNVVQAFGRIDTRRWFTIPAQFYRFKGAPRSETRRQVGSCWVLSTAKYTARAFEDVNLHLLFSSIKFTVGDLRESSARFRSGAD